MKRATERWQCRTKAHWNYKILVRGLLGIVACGSALSAQAQLGGRASFTFLQVPTNARLAGLGGVQVSSADGDVNMLLSNPALLDSAMHNRVAFNFLPYYADIAYTSLTYARQVGKTGHWGAGVQYLNYGEMPQTDPAGNVLGTFRSADFAFTLAHAHRQGNFTLGAGVKFVGSTIETYAAYALLADMGGVFQHPTHDWKIGLVVKNVGFRLRNYTPDDRAALPLDVQIGTSFKPKFMPLRFSLTMHQLQRFNITYNDPNQPGTLDANGNEVKPTVGFFDQLARHWVVGAEVLLHRNVQLRLGYNHLINRELSLANATGGAGFSFGATVRVRAFEVAVSRMFYHAVGGRSSFTLLCDTGRLLKKKTISNQP